MTKAEKRKLSELSLIYGVPIITQARENSRLAGLQRKLQKLIMPDLMTLPNMGTEEAAYVDEHIEGWLKKIGWWGNAAHLGSLISFCLDMLEKSPFTYNPRILETLLQIAEHLENGKELSYENIQAGTVIADSWQKIYA